MMTEVHATANAYWIFAKNKGDTYEQKKAILAIFMMAFLIIIGFVFLHLEIPKRKQKSRDRKYSTR